MYAEIHAVTEEKADSPGKRSFVNTGEYELSFGDLLLKNPDDPDKYLGGNREISTVNQKGREGEKTAPHY